VATGWWFALPGIAVYLFVMIVPALRGLYYSLTSWNGLSSGSKLIGIGNFTELLKDPEVLGAIRQTLLLTAAIAIGLTITGLVLALALHATLKTRNILRVAFFAPVVVAPVMVAFLWQYILAPFGALNSLLSALGLSRLELPWLGSDSLALWSVAAVIIWQFSGYAMVILLAGLEAIPKEINEAATVDGASRLQRLLHVTLPMLRPALMLTVTLALIMGLRQFETVWVLTQGGPGNSTQTMATVMYTDAFTLNNYGYATAQAVVLTLIVIVASGALNALGARRRSPKP
jgi:raffinose/stachyose/melibiose transport system permease protein